MLMVVAALTILYGNLCALPQRNLKRLLAYSGIANAGYLLMGIVAQSGEGTAAILYYLAGYLFTLVAAFMIINLLTRDGEGEDISCLAGLGKRSPFLAVDTDIVPPCRLLVSRRLAGFFGKFLLMKVGCGRGVWQHRLLRAAGRGGVRRRRFRSTTTSGSSALFTGRKTRPTTRQWRSLGQRESCLASASRRFSTSDCCPTSPSTGPTPPPRSRLLPSKSASRAKSLPGSCLAKRFISSPSRATETIGVGRSLLAMIVSIVCSVVSSTFEHGLFLFREISQRHRLGVIRLAKRLVGEQMLELGEDVLCVFAQRSAVADEIVAAAALRRVDPPRHGEHLPVVVGGHVGCDERPAFFWFASTTTVPSVIPATMRLRIGKLCLSPLRLNWVITAPLLAMRSYSSAFSAG